MVCTFRTQAGLFFSSLDPGNICQATIFLIHLALLFSPNQGLKALLTFILCQMGTTQRAPSITGARSASIRTRTGCGTKTALLLVFHRHRFGSTMGEALANLSGFSALFQFQLPTR